MSIRSILSDNGNCLTYKVDGIVDSSEFAAARKKFSRSNKKYSNLSYIVIDFSDTLEIVCPEEKKETVHLADESDLAPWSNYPVAILSDRLMIHAYSDVWRDDAAEFGWNYELFTDRASLEEWVLGKLGDEYDGEVSQSSILKRKNINNGMAGMGFVLDPLTEFFSVDIALIMSYDDGAIEILQSSSQLKNNPYKVGPLAELSKKGSFFEYVIHRDTGLSVIDATKTKKWKENPSLEHGFISYVGLPIHRPDGEIFGLVSLLSKKPIRLNAKKKDVLFGTRDMLESQLRRENDKNLIYQHLREILDLHSSLEKESKTDYLTGFYNRKNFLDIVDNEISRSNRSNTSMSFIFCDLDHFKTVNDNFGHDGGDEVLRNVSNLIKTHIRSYDVVWRWGGEEFLILLPETDFVSAEEVANKLRAIIDEAEFNYHDQIIKVTMSFGVSEIYKDEDIRDFLIRLDKLLYSAKHSGRNCVVGADTSRLEAAVV